MSDYENVRAAQAQSGKWHLVGKHGCLNAGQAVFTERVSRIADDKRTREWCRYCEERLRQLELRAEVERLKAELEGYRAIDALPNHLTLPEAISHAVAAESVYEFQQAIRCGRAASKQFLNALNLRPIVDEKVSPSNKTTEGPIAGPNHDVAALLDSPEHTGWGQTDPEDVDE